MTQVQFGLWLVFGLAVVAIVVLQIRSMIAAARVGGGSARAVIALRAMLVAAMLGLFGYVVFVQVTR